MPDLIPESFVKLSTRCARARLPGTVGSRYPDNHVLGDAFRHDGVGVGPQSRSSPCKQPAIPSRTAVNTFLGEDVHRSFVLSYRHSSAQTLLLSRDIAALLTCPEGYPIGGSSSSSSSPSSSPASPHRRDFCCPARAATAADAAPPISRRVAPAFAACVRVGVAVPLRLPTETPHRKRILHKINLHSVLLRSIGYNILHCGHRRSPRLTCAAALHRVHYCVSSPVS